MGGTVDCGKSLHKALNTFHAGAQSAQRKALDVLNSIGLSDSVLRMIDRRQQWDKWLTYGGMVVTLLVLALMWWWMRARKH